MGMAELLSSVEKTSREIAKRGEHKPMMFVSTPDGTVNVVGIPMSEEVKQAFQVGIPRMLRDMEATSYIFVIEGWATNSPKATRRVGGRVSKLPLDDRFEVLQLLCCEKGKPAFMKIAKIDSSPKTGRVVGEFEDWGGEISGRMVITEW
jgi:hypothetical protein